MKKVVVIAYSVLIVLSMGQFSATVDKLLPDDVATITVTNFETRITIPISAEQIRAFIEAYNTAKYYRNDVETTHPLYAEIHFKNGSIMRVYGGVGDFISAGMDGRGFNLKCKQLGFWFDDLQRTKAIK